MVLVRVETVQALQQSVNDGRISTASRSLLVRRFCNEYKPSGPETDHRSDDESRWTRVDTDHLLTISSDMARLSNYLVERVVAAA